MSRLFQLLRWLLIGGITLVAFAALSGCQSVETEGVQTPNVAADEKAEPPRDLQRERRQRMGK
ncbi:hypothetical protein [Algisphaera agarilytica]|uniref:Uncharacterized protein n=1 Tax=Algisphaera agarilytica TaxID=1385975 RepID=A0A7X0LKM6_9BACT|nr:hypothetical protein [Algisphaera agarilytica]MBB6430605.1 hypothetical protein [Algisphaera agarilytica]